MTVLEPASNVNTRTARSGSCSISARGVIEAMQVTPLPKEIGEQTRHVGQPAERRRSAIAFHDGAAQVVAVDAGLPFRAAETNLGDRMNRRQLVTQRDPAILELGIDAHVFEPRQAEEMGHGLPHLAHRQRPTGERFDDAGEHRDRRSGGLQSGAAPSRRAYRDSRRWRPRRRPEE